MTLTDGERIASVVAYLRAANLALGGAYHMMSINNETESRALGRLYGIMEDIKCIERTLREARQ